MPLSPLVSAEVSAVGVAVQDFLSGVPPPFSCLAAHRTSEPNHGVNSRRFRIHHAVQGQHVRGRGCSAEKTAH